MLTTAFSSRSDPWGHFSFFKATITAPFEQKDPKALEAIQFVLESILLRREKSMKDKNGQPIVALPQKHKEDVELEFSGPEREIYDAVFKKAKVEWEGYAKSGTVLQ